MKNFDNPESDQFLDYRSGYWDGVRQRHLEIREIGLLEFERRLGKVKQSPQKEGLFDKVISWFS
jgi:hypothetical protein